MQKFLKIVQSFSDKSSVEEKLLRRNVLLFSGSQNFFVFKAGSLKSLKGVGWGYPGVRRGYFGYVDGILVYVGSYMGMLSLCPQQELD